MDEYIIYSDGAYSPNRNQGGIGFVVLKNGKKIYSYNRAFISTTNQRMELLAVIIALESINNPSYITIYTDSQYVIGVLSKGWERNSNKYLLERADNAIARHKSVKFEWCKGHGDTEWNIEADFLAVQASNFIIQ